MTEQTDKWIVPKGTTVVLNVVKQDLKGRGHGKPGHVGKVDQCPENNDHSYVVVLPLNRVLSDKPDDDITPKDEVLRVRAMRHEFVIQKEAVKIHLEKMRKAFDVYLDRMGLEAIMGSRAYGLTLDDNADRDYKGIYLARNEDILGLRGFTQTFNGKTPNGDDFEYHELGKFLTICLKGNSTYLELLWAMPDVKHAWAQELLDNRKKLLSKHIFNSYGGYAINQFKLLARGEGKRWNARRDRSGKGSTGVSKTSGLVMGDHDLATAEDVNWKHASHLIRVLVSGTHALQMGEILVDFSDHPMKNRLLDIKRGNVTLSQVFSDKDAWVEQFNEAFKHTDVPDGPDFEWADSYLVRTRTNYGSKS